MLATDIRLLLSEAIAPPEDHELDLLVVTTYSLDLAALLSVPLALTFGDWEGSDGRPATDPIAALEAVRRYAERVTVFCQAGATAATDQAPIVASWLEEVVVPVTAPGSARRSRRGVFHPKVWVARYRDGGRGVRYRILCGSRNLTFDRSWDTVVVLDGARAPRGGQVAASGPLADFVSALPGMARSGIDRRRAKAIRDLAGELRHVRFATPEGFDGLAFHPLGIKGYTGDPFAGRRITRMLVISPFLKASRLRLFRPELQNNVLISRPDEIAKIAAKDLKGFDRVCALDDATATDADADDVKDGMLRGLHAKLYVLDAGHASGLWVGSANATVAAFERNVEFLVELPGRRSGSGVDAVLGQPEDLRSLAALLTDVTPSPAPVEPNALELLQDQVDELALDIAGRRFTATVAGGPDRFTVELVATPPLSIPAEARIRCWPLTEPRDRYPSTEHVGGSQVTTFDDLELAAITAFFGIEVELSGTAGTVSTAFAIRAELVDVPSGRREAITRSVLRDPEQVMQLLRMLLAFDPDAPNQGAGELIGHGGAWLVSEVPLLEALLRALADAPSRIDAVASLIDDLGDAAADVLPPEFASIWEPIRAARDKAKGRR